MVFLSSEPLTSPFSAVVAYLTVLHVIVCSLKDTWSGTGGAACAMAGNADITESIAAETTAPAKRTPVRMGTRTAIDVALERARATILVHRRAGSEFTRFGFAVSRKAHQRRHNPICNKIGQELTLHGVDRSSPTITIDRQSYFLSLIGPLDSLA